MVRPGNLIMTSRCCLMSPENTFFHLYYFVQDNKMEKKHQQIAIIRMMGGTRTRKPPFFPQRNRFNDVWFPPYVQSRWRGSRWAIITGTLEDAMSSPLRESPYDLPRGEPLKPWSSFFPSPSSKHWVAAERQQRHPWRYWLDKSSDLTSLPHSWLLRTFPWGTHTVILWTELARISLCTLPQASFTSFLSGARPLGNETPSAGKAWLWQDR